MKDKTYLDLGSFDYTCNDFDEYVVVCSICAEISSTIHSDCDVGVVTLAVFIEV